MGLLAVAVLLGQAAAVGAGAGVAGTGAAAQGPGAAGGAAVFGGRGDASIQPLKAVLPGKIHGGIAVGARTDIRTYNIPGYRDGWDNTASAFVGGFLMTNHWTLRLGYAPTWLDEAFNLPSPYHFYALEQSGFGGVTFALPLKRWSLLLGVDGSMSFSAIPAGLYGGALNAELQGAGGGQTAGLGIGNGTQGSPVPVVVPTTTLGAIDIPYSEAVLSGTGRAYATANYSVSKRTTVYTTVSGSTSGGFGYDAQLFDPISRTAGVVSSVGYTFNPRDSISTNANVSYVVAFPLTAPRNDAYLFGVTEGYRHVFSKFTTGTVYAGAVFASTLAENETHRYFSSSFAGNAALLYARRLDRKSNFGVTLAATYGLALSLYGYGADQFVTVTSSAFWSRRPWGANAYAAYTTTVDASPPQRFATVGTTFTFTPVRALQFAIGVADTFQVFPEFAVPAGATPDEISAIQRTNATSDADQWVAFAAVSVAFPLLSF